MGSMLAMDSAWNVMTSSIRLRNSGRKVLRSASLILLDSSAKLFAAVSTSPFMTFSMTSPMVSFWAFALSYSRMAWEPMLLVMMIMAFLNDTKRPWPSVKRPSSSTCSKILKTSG